MILVYFFIILFFIWYAKKNFAKSLILFAAVYHLFNSGMAIRYQPPAITVNLVLILFFVIIYYFKYRQKYQSFEEPFFKRPFIWMIISIIVSIGVALLDGNISALTMGIRMILSEYVFILIFWNVCKTRQDLYFFTKCILIVFCIVFSYGIFEYMTNSNPILEIIYAHIPSEYADDKLYISDLGDINRGGRARFQSLFYITILYGVCSILFAFYIITVFKMQKEFILKKKYLLLLLILSLFACYLCNSKTPVIAIPIIFLPYLLKNKFSIFTLIVLIIFINPDFFNSFLGNIIDLDSLNVNNDVSDGSSAAMRIRQLNIAINAFMNAPVCGNGLKYSSYLSSTVAGAELLGAESCWFKLLIEQGTFGLIAFVYIICVFLKKGYEISKYEGKILLFFALGFFVIVSITDIGYSLFYVLFIAMYKILKNKNAN